MSDYAVDRLAPGDHVCWIYGRDEEYLPAVARFVTGGLKERQRVVYLTGARAADAVADGLAVHAEGVRAAVDSGQLRLDPDLFDGRFEPVRVTSSLARDIDRAVADGYRGLRLIADMGWASGEVRLPGYEERANELFLDGRALAVCLYDRRLFGSAGLTAASCAHPSTLVPGLDGHWTPTLRVRRTGRASLALSGEADLTNRRALAALLDLLVTEADGAPAPARLEVGGLTFLDAGGAALVARTAMTAPGGLDLAGATAPITHVLTLTGVVSVPGLRLADGAYHRPGAPQ